MINRPDILPSSLANRQDLVAVATIRLTTATKHVQRYCQAQIKTASQSRRYDFDWRSSPGYQGLGAYGCTIRYLLLYVLVAPQLDQPI